MLEFCVKDSLKQEDPFIVQCPAEAMTAAAYIKASGGHDINIAASEDADGWLGFSYMDSKDCVHHCRIKRKGY